jgi:hypothetical protein
MGKVTDKATSVRLQMEFWSRYFDSAVARQPAGLSLDAKIRNATDEATQMLVATVNHFDELRATDATD